jgi:Ca-activated chloride channel family protein
VTEFGTPYLSIIAVFAGLLWLALDRGYIVTTSLPVSLKNYKRGLKVLTMKNVITVLGIISWVLIAYGVASPRKVEEIVPGKIKVNDIMFVVDISQSMTIRDLRPNRLEVAKNKIFEFVEMRPTDRIGIIVFSERVLTLLPLTIDNELVKQVVSEIQIVPTLGSGTNIGDSLALAVGRLKPLKTENKVIILLTDGVSNVDTIGPLEVAKIAKDEEIKIYTIGIGVDKDAKLPGRGGISNRATPGGAIDFKLLKEVSSITKAKSFTATSEKGLKQVFDEIQSLEKTEIDSSNTVIYNEQYYTPLALGVIILILVEALKKFYQREVL